MKTFVMGDIHGAAKALNQCFERSGFDPDTDILIQLGDVTDGYPDVFACVEILLTVRNLIAIKGNHDNWFLEFTATGFHPQFWNQGGLGTLKSYLRYADKPDEPHVLDSVYETKLVPSDVPATHRNFFIQQRLFYVDEDNRCFVHGGFRLDIPFDQQRSLDFYWDRSLWDNAYRYKQPVSDFSEVYLGHTPTLNWGVDRPLKASNVWNLDTGAGHAGRLTMMDVDTKDYWQSDRLPKLYNENFR